MELFNRQFFFCRTMQYLTNVSSQRKRISPFESIRLMSNVLKGGHYFELHVPNIIFNTYKYIK